LNTFYALMDTRTPVMIAIISIAANALCGVILMWPMEHNGLALALSMASILNLILLTLALRRKLGALGWRHLALSAARSAMCAALMGICVWALALQLLPSADLSWVRLLIGLTVCIGFGAIVFGGFAFAFKAPELQAVFQMAAKRKPSS
jgi:putative peptidoglycan lipid II flippase